MKAIVHETFGGPEALALVDRPVPELTPDGVLVRVRAVSLNRADWYDLNGQPWLARFVMGWRKPKDSAVGADFSGTAEAVGADVTDVQVGDDVFGLKGGSLAEYVCATDAIALKPANVDFDTAACAGIAGLTALQGLRDKGGLQAGQKVLINGASGSVGTFAIPIAKALGAEVTAVCSTRNVEQARALGADRVIDYTQEDFTAGGSYDLIVDIAGSKPWRRVRRVLPKGKTLVVIGGPMRSRLLGPLGHLVATMLMAIGSGRKVAFFVAKPNREDLAFLGALLADGTLKPVIERRYALDEAAEAFGYLGEGHVRSKLVIGVDGDSAG